MSGQSATEVTGHRSDTVPQQIRPAFYCRRRISCEKMQRLSGAPDVALPREHTAEPHSAPIACATEPRAQALELMSVERPLAALVCRRVIASDCFSPGRGV